MKLRTAPKRAAQRHKTEEGFLHFVVAVPQERDEKQRLATTPVGMTEFRDRPLHFVVAVPQDWDEKQRLATTPVGMTEFRDRPLTKSSRALALKSRRRILPGANPHP